MISVGSEVLWELNTRPSDGHRSRSMVIVCESSSLHIVSLFVRYLLVVWTRSLDVMSMVGLFRMQHRRRMQIANRQRHNHKELQDHP